MRWRLHVGYPPGDWSKGQIDVCDCVMVAAILAVYAAIYFSL